MFEDVLIFEINISKKYLITIYYINQQTNLLLKRVTLFFIKCARRKISGAINSLKNKLNKNGSQKCRKICYFHLQNKIQSINLIEMLQFMVPLIKIEESMEIRCLKFKREILKLLKFLFLLRLLIL